MNLTLFNRLPLHPQSNSIVGDFTSVNLLEVDNSTPPTFAARMQQQQERLWQDLDHRYFSGIQVMRDLSRFQRVGPTAIMPVVFTSLLNLGDHGDGLTWSSRLGKCVYAITQTPQVYLDFMVYEEKALCKSTAMRWRNFSPLVCWTICLQRISDYCTIWPRTIPPGSERWRKMRGG
jgi:non-ribosomal peptide synthetase component F